MFDCMSAFDEENYMQLSSCVFNPRKTLALQIWLGCHVLLMEQFHPVLASPAPVLWFVVLGS